MFYLSSYFFSYSILYFFVERAFPPFLGYFNQIHAYLDILEITSPKIQNYFFHYNSLWTIESLSQHMSSYFTSFILSFYLWLLSITVCGTIWCILKYVISLPDYTILLEFLIPKMVIFYTKIIILLFFVSKQNYDHVLSETLGLL